MKDRSGRIVEYVSLHGQTEVSALAEFLKVSEVTVRKDLDRLAEKGILKRERGFARLCDTTSINYRMAFHFERKRKIAECAAELVRNGETILLDSGSTCALFAEALANRKKDVSIMTNSVYILNFIKDRPNIQVILLGGNYQRTSEAMVGPMTEACLRGLRVGKIFVGTDGYSREEGFTGDDLIRAGTLRAMIMAAEQTYVLTESEKLKKKGTVSFLPLSEVYGVITDSGIAAEEEKFLSDTGIRICKAD